MSTLVGTGGHRGPQVHKGDVDVCKTVVRLIRWKIAGAFTCSKALMNNVISKKDCKHETLVLAVAIRRCS